MSRKTEPRTPDFPNGNCPECGGDGKVGMYWERCNTCDGTGYVSEGTGETSPPKPSEPIELDRLEKMLDKVFAWAENDGDFMLCMDSYYFDADTISTLRFDDIGNSFYLCIRTNLKNYDSEIEHFIDWIMPYLDKYETGQFLGFYRYEEDEQPTLIFYKEEKS